MASIKDYIDELRQQVAELKEHPFKNTTINDYYGDWNVRFFKRHLCVWDDLEELKGYTGWNAEEYCEKLNGQKQNCILYLYIY